MALIYFLIAYNQRTGEVFYKEFEDADLASVAYADCEARYRERPEIEVVLLGADSIETIRQTHPNYFERDHVPFAASR